MAIGTLIKRQPVTAAPCDSLAVVARIMADKNVGAVAIVEGGKPVGIITDRDIALATCVRGLSQASAAATVMTRPVTTAFEYDGVLECTNLMMRESVRRLAIVDAHDRLVGMVSVDDLIPHLSQELSNIAKDLQYTTS